MPGKPWVPKFVRDLFDGVDVSTDTTLAGNSNLKLPTEKAVKAYVDAHVANVITADTTYTVKTANGDFTTLSGALASLASVRIAPGATVTLQVADGVWDLTTLTIDHPDSNRIKIVGTSVYTMTCNSGTVTVAGAVPNMTAAFTVDSAANAAVNDYVLISTNKTTAAASSQWFQFNGVYKITAVAGNVVTIAIPVRFPVVNLTVAGSALTLDIIKTVFRFNAGNGVQVQGGNYLKLLDRVVVLGNAVAGSIGLYVTSDSAVSGLGGGRVGLGNYFGVTNFATGVFVSNGGVVMGASLFASNNTSTGVKVEIGGVASITTNYRLACTAGGSIGAFIGGSLVAIGGVFCGNAGNGVQVQKGGQAILNNAASIRNGTGVYASGRATVQLDTGIVAYSNNDGVIAFWHSYVSLYGCWIEYNVVSGNVAYFGIRLSQNAYAVNGGATFTSNGGGGNTSVEAATYCALLN